MAQTFRSLSSLLIVVACCFLNGATAEEREGKQILLPAVPPYPLYFYANNPVAPVYVNAGEAPVEMDARVTSSDAVGRTFFRIFGCPTCPTCPAPVICPTCPTPATPADGVIFIPTTTGCTTTDLAATLCTRASAAPKGTIDVTFTVATTSVLIGIVGATPTTAIRLTCTSFPTNFVTGLTQFGTITAGANGNPTINGVGFVQVLASSGALGASNSLKCTWSS